jgi:hypothetical protein
MNLRVITNYFYPYRILDIGANVGQFHRECKATFNDSYIFSIEASAECESSLQQITENYYIGLLAKDNTDDQLDIIKTNGIKLDDLFESDSEFDLIKIDTQGSELDIIEGGLNLCNKAKGILLEVSLTQYNENAPLYDEVISYMESIGFKKTEILDEVRNHGSHQQDILFINEKLINRSN